MSDPRIVSLLGSATEIVYELGLERHLVGISHECDYPPEALSLPRVSRPRFDPDGLDSGAIDAEVRRCMEEYGSVYEIDVERLRGLKPTLLLTQAVCEVCAVPTASVEDVVASLTGPVRVVSLDAHTIDEILHTIDQVADAAGRPERGRTVVGALSARLDRVRSRVPVLDRPDVLLLEWLDPPFAPGHWVPEMVEYAGGSNLLGARGGHSVQLDWSELVGIDPDVLLIEPCGFDLDMGEADANRNRQRLLSAAGRAVDSRRAWVLHSAWFSRSGPRIVAGVELLAHLLHPEAFPAITTYGRARRWS